MTNKPITVFGEVLFDQGARADAIYVVRTGRLEVIVPARGLVVLEAR